MNNKKTGFTLIEIVVVVGVLGSIIVTVASVLLNSFKAKARIEVTDKIERNGGIVLSELKSGVVNASGVDMLCVGSTLTYTSSIDGGVTNLVCYEGTKIASESANGVFDLTSSDVAVSGCNNFVQCDLYSGSTDRTTQVDFVFGLIAGDAQAGAGQQVNRQFQSTIVVRN
jgi:prepilin-type N-terminal cleavage/methylation domain-containing protein